MKNRKIVFGIFIVFLFTVFASSPFFRKEYIPTHDGEYHIIRFIEFYRMISEGYLIPRWAPNMNSGYGIPIFLFHYPLPNYIGAIIQRIGFHAVDAFKISLAFGYISSGIFSFLWLKKLFHVKAATVGAISAAFVPYWFVDLYVRGSVGEVWAIAFVFAGLMFCEYGMFIPFSFAIAGLVLSHNILAMLFIPFLFGVALLRNKRYTIGILIGILLSSYFWIPAIAESVYVVGLNTVQVQEHFAEAYELIIPSWGTALSGQMFSGNKMSLQIGIVPLLIFFMSIFVSVKEKGKEINRFYRYVAMVCIFAVIFTLSWTFLLWKYIPFLQYVQYPWRFLSFVIPATAFTGAYVSYHFRMRIASIIIIFLSVIFSYSYTRPVVYSPRDGYYYMSRKNFTDGTSSMGNSFSTIWTGWKNKRSEYLLRVVNGKVKGSFSKNSYLDKQFIVASETGAQVDIPILYFPGWAVRVDNQSIGIEYQIDGTIRFFVPSGEHRVRVVFSRPLMRKFADTLSILVLVWLTLWGILGVYENRHRHISFLWRPH